MSNLHAELAFDPAHAAYIHQNSRYYRKGKRYISPDKYWYARAIIDGKMCTIYLGKDLPAECIPYAKDHLSLDGTSSKGYKPRKRYGTIDTIKDALDKGEQVIVDIPKLAIDCDAYYSHIQNHRYVIYRDPKKTMPKETDAGHRQDDSQP